MASPCFFEHVFACAVLFSILFVFAFLNFFSLFLI